VKNLDPLIRREYKRLGMNIVPDDALADLIFAKVQYQRIRTVAITAIVLSAIVIGVFFGWRLTDTSPANSANPTNSSNSLSFTQEPTGGDVLPLPQAGYRNIDVSNPETAKLEYTFALESGWIIQEITDNRDPIMGPAGTVDVFLVTQDQEQLVQQYQMSSRTQINEFGVPASGIYKFVLNFTNPNFKGQVRVAFVRLQ
jgi:hypothetical protein